MSGRFFCTGPTKQFKNYAGYTDKNGVPLIGLNRIWALGPLSGRPLPAAIFRTAAAGGGR